MGYRDIELLAAVSGNLLKFEEIFDRLRRYADSVALTLFSNFVLREDAVQRAMDKAKDWLGTDSALRIDHPWSYIKRIISNSLIDSGRTRKLEGVSLGAKMAVKHGNVRRQTIRHQMAWIDEQFAEFDDEEGGGEENKKGSGWQVFQIIEQALPRKEVDDRFHPHRWIEGLNLLRSYQWWWHEDLWRKKILSERKERMERFNGAREEAASKHSEYGKKLWSKYNLIMALIDNISSSSEKRVVQHFLWGFKAVQITQEFNISKPYVSKVLNGKWLREWGWGERDIYQARLILLTHYLADRYGDTKNVIKSPHVPPRLKELKRQMDKLFPQWLEIEDEMGKYTVKSLAPPQELEAKMRSIEASMKESAEQIKTEEQKLTPKQKISENEFYDIVINKPQTKAYFYDLGRSDNVFLLETCQSLFYRWYPYSRLVNFS